MLFFPILLDSGLEGSGGIEDECLPILLSILRGPNLGKPLKLRSWEVLSSQVLCYGNWRQDEVRQRLERAGWYASGDT